MGVLVLYEGVERDWQASTGLISGVSVVMAQHPSERPPCDCVSVLYLDGAALAYHSYDHINCRFI